jgi:hypothetical protein
VHRTHPGGFRFVRARNAPAGFFQEPELDDALKVGLSAHEWATTAARCVRTWGLDPRFGAAKDPLQPAARCAAFRRCELELDTLAG